MRAVAAQTVIGGLDSEKEEAAEVEAGYLWREQLWSAMRSFAIGYISASGAKGYDACAAELDKRWGEQSGHGRPVSGSLLRAALTNTERNYFRLEWLDWFAARSPEISDLAARRVKPTKTEAELRADLEAEIRDEYPRQADRIIRRARAR